MPRSYVRLDPGFADRKRPYPDGPYRALIDVFCAAEYEPTRGQFRSMAILRAVIGKSARHLPYLFAKHDIALTADDRIQVVGWDEWQEGNWQVAERMRRVRERREGLVMVPTVTTALQPVDEPTVMVSSEQVGGKPLAVGGRRLAATETPAPDERYEAPEFEALQWLGRHNCYLRPGDGFHQKLILLVEKFGINRVVGTLDRLSAAGVLDGDTKRFVFGASDALFPDPDLRVLERQDRADEERQRFNRGVAATQREHARARGETA